MKKSISEMISSYNGPPLPPEISCLLRVLYETHGIERTPTGSSKGTIRLKINNRDIGYVNRTVIDHGGVFGYKFQRPKPNDSCSPEEKENLIETFVNKYDIGAENLIIQQGTGTNTGRYFLIVKTKEAAQKIIKTDLLDTLS